MTKAHIGGVQSGSPGQLVQAGLEPDSLGRSHIGPRKTDSVLSHGWQLGLRGLSLVVRSVSPPAFGRHVFLIFHFESLLSLLKDENS